MNPLQYLEFALLQAFAEMLNIEIPTASFNASELEKTKTIIKNKLNSGIKATTTVNGVTPLMLYTAFHIMDQRFDDEFQKEDEFNRKTNVSLHPLTSLQSNVLDVAALFKNEIAVERLLNTKLFSKHDDHQQALELAAHYNLLKTIRLFIELKYNLFASFAANAITPLSIACAFNNVEVVREILSTNPSEQELDIADRPTDATAADFVFNHNNAEIVSMFLPTKRYQQALLINAFNNDNSAAIKTILNDTVTTSNLLLLRTQCKSDSLLAWLYDQLEDRHDGFVEPLISEFENYLSKQPAYQQINTLLLTYANMFHIDTEAANKYWQQLSKILETLPRDKVLKEFIIPSFINCNYHAVLPQVRNVVEKIIEFNLIEQLYFAKPEGMTEADAIFIINCLKDNTSIVQCDITWLKALSQPLKNMIELICKRNIAITQAQTHLVKDAIFNSSVVEINGLINAYQEDATIDAKTRMRLEPHIKTARVYSLMELAAVTFYTTPCLPKGCEEIPLMAETCTDMLNNMSLLPQDFRQTPNPK